MNFKKRKNTSYITAKESHRISRFNRQLTRRLERERAAKGTDPPAIPPS